MNKEKLIELGVPEEIADTVLTAVTEEINAGVTEGVKNSGELTKANKKISSLEEKVTALEGERDTLSGKLTEKDMSYAAEKLFDGYKFSSPLAKEAAMAKFRASEPEFKDGKYTGGEGWIEELKKNEPSAFAGSTPPPTLMTGSGAATAVSDAQARKIMGLPLENK
ncbi:MAG: hypothetical protein IJ366_09425 [Clostridia bacterium]|nr:hypothetical protein [Clostridia bacterium]